MSDEDFDIEKISKELQSYASTKRQRILSKLAEAALGSIPWVGGFMAAMTSFRAGEQQAETNSLQKQWLEEHAKKIQELAATISLIMDRFDVFGEVVRERIESKEYIQIIRKGFSDWDSASTDQKRHLVIRLITNAGISQLCSDDVIRLFQDWLVLYHEIHFSVIACVFKNPGWTRGQIWREIRGSFPREDSAEADLFKLLIRDLSTGGIIRQRRETDYAGNYLKKTPAKGTKSPNLKSAFDYDEPYELTDLGRQFIHYTMEELVPRLTNSQGS